MLSNTQLLKFWLFNFSNFQTTVVKNFMIKIPGFKRFTASLIFIIWNFSTMKQWLFKFFLKFARKSVLPLKFCQMREIKASILLTLLKWFVVGYSNGNESLAGRLFSNYGPLNILFHFFRYLIYSIFHEAFVKTFIKKLSLLYSNFKNPFQDVVNYRKLGCLTLWYWNGSPLNIR